MNPSGKVVVSAKGLVKKYGRVVALDEADFELRESEILAVVGDNGAGKSSLIKALSGAIAVDRGAIELEGRPVRFESPKDAKEVGVETVYQTLAVCPSLGIGENLFLGREIRKSGFLGKCFRMLDRRKMNRLAKEKMTELGLLTIQNMNQAVETLSGGQRQGVAVARASAFGTKVVIFDEPTAALGVKESRKVLDMIREVRDKGISVILISHNIPHVFELADRIHVHRLGRRIAVVKPETHTMSEVVSIMTGALRPEDHPSGAFAR